MGNATDTVDRATGRPLDPPVTRGFNHVYDYVSFHVGPPPAVQFAQPCGIECVPVDPTWNSDPLPATPCPGLPADVCTAGSGSDSGKSDKTGVPAAVVAVVAVVCLGVGAALMRAVQAAGTGTGTGSGSGTQAHPTFQNPTSDI